ncbi:MAG: flagellar brake protein [Aquabacterium sp.]
MTSMSFADTQPAPLADDDGGPDPYAAFRVESPGEVLALMRQLQTGSVPVQLSTPRGAHISTLLWAVDATQRRISFGIEADHPMVQRLAESDEVTGVAYLESVKLQFDLAGVHLVRGPRASALQSAMPRRLYRFQRRSGYRVRTLERGTPTAQLRHPSMPDMALQLRVLDVSIGGCALFLPHDVPPISMGVRLEGVRIELDADTGFETALQLHHVTAINADATGVRLGCEFLDPTPAAERALQRYIDATQKRRRLLSLN